MCDELDLIAASALYYLSTCRYYLALYENRLNKQNRQKKDIVQKKIRKRRRFWMSEHHQDRTVQGVDNLWSKIVESQPKDLPNFCRMSSSDFELLLNKIGPLIEKKNTYMREAIPAKVRLAVTLRFLASGDSYRILHLMFKMSTQIISKIIPEVCAAINEALKDEIKLPETPEEWLSKDSFSFPHCIGVLSGHCVFVKNCNVAANFYIPILALIDSKFCFTFVELGKQETKCNADMFKDHLFLEQICSDSLKLPSPCPVQENDINLPYVFLSNGPFVSSKHVLVPFKKIGAGRSPEYIFNKLHESTYSVADDVFAIIQRVFQVFKKPLAMDMEKASVITKTCILLHNFLIRSESSHSIYTPPGALGAISDDQKPLDIQYGLISFPLTSDTLNPDAVQVRRRFANYFAKNNFDI